MCDKAGLILGWDDEKRCVIVARADCDSWRCTECADRMRTKWVLRAGIGARALMRSGLTLDFVTMTGHEDLKSFAATERVWRSVWAVLYAALKRKAKILEYIIIPERHKDGRMHVHALWTANVSQKWLKDNGRKRGAGHQAKVRPVADEYDAMFYVTKYLKKDLGNDAPRHFRRVRVSRGWAKVPTPDTALSNLKWEYVGTNGALYMAYMRAEDLGYRLIDAATGGIFDDVDLGTLVYTGRMRGEQQEV